MYINLVVWRYDTPEDILGVHYDEGDHTFATLVAKDQLHNYFELGNEIEYTLEEIDSHIPIEWKTPDVTEEWLRSRVTAYDKITRRAVPIT